MIAVNKDLQDVGTQFTEEDINKIDFYRRTLQDYEGISSDNEKAMKMINDFLNNLLKEDIRKRIHKNLSE